VDQGEVVGRASWPAQRPQRAFGAGQARTPTLLTLLLPALALAQDAGALYREGARLFAERQIDSAIAAFQRSVQLRPDFAPAWKALGVAFASRGDYESAETPFRNACERQPKLPDVCLYYGRTLYLLNRFQPAIDVLRKEPANFEACRLLALSLEALGDREAGDAFRRALSLYRVGPPDEDPGIDYGVFLFRQGQAEEDRAPLTKALDRHPDSARAHLELGAILLALDQLDAAAAHLERAVALQPANARAHLLLGKVQSRQGSRTVK
jgi:Flp pilus assembly protein TadD